jgi:hypothetical protein
LTGRHYFLENLPGILILFDHFSSEKEITGTQTDLFAINVFFEIFGFGSQQFFVFNSGRTFEAVARGHYTPLSADKAVITAHLPAFSRVAVGRLAYPNVLAFAGSHQLFYLFFGCPMVLNPI